MARYGRFYDEDEEKNLKSTQPSTSTTTQTSYGRFQAMPEEPVKQQLEVKQEPIKEDIQPLAQQPVKQEPVEQDFKQKVKTGLAGVLDKISNVIDTAKSEGFTKLSTINTDTQKSIKQDGALLAAPQELSDLEKRELQVKKKAGLEATSKKVTERELLIRKMDNPVEYFVNRPYAKTDEGYLQGDVDRTPMEAMEYKLKASADFYKSLTPEEKVRILSPDFVNEESYFAVAVSARDTISRIEQDLEVLNRDLSGLKGKDKTQAEKRIKELEAQISGLEMVEKGAYNERGVIAAVGDFFSNKESIPLAGGVFSAEEAIITLGAYKKLEAGEELNDREKMLIERNEKGDTIKYLTNNYNFGYEVTSGLLGSVSLMAEFILAGIIFQGIGLGLQAVGVAPKVATALTSAGALKVGAKATTKVGIGASKIATGALQGAVRAGQVTVTSGMGRIVADATERQTPVYQYYWKTGDSIKTEEGVDPAQAWTKAIALEYGNNLIETGIGYQDPTKIANNLLRQGALSSFPNEFGEEILQKIWDEAGIEGKKIVLPKDYTDPETQFTFTPRELVVTGAVTLMLGTVTSALDKGEITQVEADIASQQAQIKLQEIYDKANGRTQEGLVKELEQEQKENPIAGTDYDGVIEEIGTETTTREVELVGIVGQDQEIEQQESATEIVERVGLEPDSINILNNEQSIVENEAGKEALLAEVPISIFGKPEFDTLAQDVYTKGERQITSPIEVTLLNDGSLRITDGANRFGQAVANEDVTIPAIVIKEDGNIPTLAEIEGKTMVQAPTREEVSGDEVTREVADKMTVEEMRAVLDKRGVKYQDNTPRYVLRNTVIRNEGYGNTAKEVLNTYFDTHEYISFSGLENWLDSNHASYIVDFTKEDVLDLAKKSKRIEEKKSKKDTKEKEPKKDSKEETKKEEKQEPKEDKEPTKKKEEPVKEKAKASKEVKVEAKEQKAVPMSEAKWEDADKMKFLNNTALDEYEKIWDKLTPQQQHKVLMGMVDGQRYIKTTDQDTLMKLGKGVDILSLKDTAVGDRQEIFLWGGQREGLYTDGMILFTDKPVVKKIIDKFQGQYITKEAQRVKKTEGISLVDAKKKVKAEFTKQRIEDMSFPETQPILDSAKANHKLTPIGFYADEINRQSGSIIFRAENGTLVRISGKYYSAIKNFYPSAEFYITDESNIKPISFVVGKTRKGIVMPMMLPTDATFTNLVGKEGVDEAKEMQRIAEEKRDEEYKVEKAKELKEEDVRDDIGLGLQEYIYDGKKLEQIPTHKGKIGYLEQGTYEYNKDTGQVVATLADGRRFKFTLSTIYDSTIEAIAKSRVDGRTWMEETFGEAEFKKRFPNGIPKKEVAEDDDIAFYTTARRRGQRSYDNITSMADIRRNLDILRKDRLGRKDVNVQENSKLVSNLLKYIGGNVKLSKQDIDALYSQAIGVDELRFDPNGYTTLYRIGEVEVGKQTAFSATKTDSENDIAYKVHRDDIVIYLNSQEFKDSLRNVDISLVEGSNSIENLQEVFETYGSVENEVIATPREVIEGGDDQLMLTDSTVATIREEDTLLQEARKYDSAEEFVTAMFTQRSDYAMSHRPSYFIDEEGDFTQVMPTASNLLEGEVLPRDVYEHPEWSLSPTHSEVTNQQSWKALLSIRNKPDADVVVYRAARKNELNIGDWITFSKEYAKDSVEGDQEQVYEFTIKAGDAVFAGDDVNEFGYYPKESLIQLWNQAQTETLKAKEDESKGSQSLETYESREVTPAEQLKMSDEVKSLVHKYADKVGEKYLPRGVLGVFYGKTKEIRLKGITDLYVASHEISHAIDTKFNITAKITPRDNVDMQLREAYINLYPTAKETHAIKTQKLEGFAMAVATYIQRPSSFEIEYPAIVKEMFTQGGKYYNTEIGEYLNDVSNIVSRYQSLNDLDRVATRISKSIPTVEQTLFKSKTEATVNMLQNDLNLFERWVKENGDTMTKADFTNLFRFRTQVKSIYENNIATNLSKKNVEAGKFKNFMGGLYSYLRKSVAQDVYMVYNPETKNIERKYDYNWGTLRREIAQKGMDRQFNSLLVARRAYYDFEYADKLKDDVARVTAELDTLTDEIIAMYQKKESERDKRAEKALEAEIAGTKVILQEIEANLAEVESLLRNDGWDRRLVTDSYLNNQGLFEKELDMFDKLVAQDILLAKNVGIISNEKYNELKDNKGYAPFKRIIYDEVLGEVDPSEISGNLKLGSQEVSSLKKRTGSTKEIIYPLQSAMRNHMEFLNKSVSQDAINTFLSERTMELHSANIKQVEWHKGIEGQKDILIRMEDGVRKAYAVDPMIKELLSGYLSPRQVDLLERVSQSYKQLFTIGTTGTYFQFVFTNIPRDAFNYITQTYQSSSIKAVYNLFADTAKVVFGSNLENNMELEYFQKYLALGGREMTFVKYMEGDYDAFTTFLRQEEKGLKKVKDTIGKVAKVGLDILSMPSQLSEMWFRSVEFIEAKKSGDSDVVALEKARRVTTPFHYRGSFKYKDKKGKIVKAPALPRYAPFQNAQLQAFAWAGGNFIKDPKIRSRMLFMMALTTALGLEELLRAWNGADDDDKEQFKDLSAEDLSRFIHMPKKGGGIRRIAVAEWAGGIAGFINMSVMDFILDEVDYSVTDYATALTVAAPDQFNLLVPVIKLLEKGTWDEFGKWGTSMLPALANPIIAIMGYKTYPEFAPLESSWQKTKLPADRYNEGTSKLAKWAMSLELPFDKGRLGDNLNLSPLQLDAILMSSFGRSIGMITGKPDAWNVLKSVDREYYFEYGRRLNDYWEIKEKNDMLYNSMTKGTREYSKEKELEVFRRKALTKDIDTALDEYREAYDSKDLEEISSTRAKVIGLVNRFNENPSTPEMEIYLANPNATTMEEAMRARALREISMKDPKDYTKDELADAKALAKEFRQEALLARSDYSYAELLFGISKNDDKVIKIEEVIEGKSEAETKKYLASLKYSGMISNDVIIKLYNKGVIDYELGKWANDLESNRNF